LAEAGLEESEEEIKIEDLSITRIMAAKDQEGNIPKFGRFVMYGFPQTEIHMSKLKEFGIVFDRVCFLNDNTEEEPGREIK
jgi:adenylate/nucleoside-diphosphate kinase